VANAEIQLPGSRETNDEVKSNHIVCVPIQPSVRIRTEAVDRRSSSSPNITISTCTGDDDIDVSIVSIEHVETFDHYFIIAVAREACCGDRGYLNQIKRQSSACDRQV